MIYLDICLNLYTPPPNPISGIFEEAEVQSGEILEPASEKRNVPDVNITHCIN